MKSEYSSFLHLFRLGLILGSVSGIVSIQETLGPKVLAYQEPVKTTPQASLEFPTVNKCCPLQQRWRGGKCEWEHGTDRRNDSSNATTTETAQKIPATGEMPLMWEASMLSSAEILENAGSDSNFTGNSTQSTLVDGPVVFRLRVSMPSCSSSESELLIEKIIHKEVLSKERLMTAEDAYQSEDLEPSVLLSTEGYLIWKDEHGLMNTRDNQDFCIDQINDTAFIALLCKPRCDDSHACIRKCCSPDSILDIENEACLPSSNGWTPFLYNTAYEPVSQQKNGRDAHYVYGIPNCEYYSFSPRQDPGDKMYALSNGSLVTVTKGKRIVYPINTFCIDGAVGVQLHSLTSDDAHFHHLDSQSPVYFSGSELDQVALICYPDDQVESEDASFDSLRYNILAFSGLASSMFLFLTALVYLINWEYQNIHGWLQFAYVASSLISFFFLAIVQLFTDEIHSYNEKLCETMGTVIHFSFLSAFFWLTSMNFDLWWTFSGWRPLRPSSRNSDKRRFCFFALFSWGLSGIIAGIGLVLDYMYKDQPDAPVTRPRFGERKCYFFGYVEQLPYFYGPVGFLLIIDLMFFTHTIYSLQKLQQDTKFATQQSSRQDKKRFILFMKIFIVMGVLWIFEVISWVIEVYVAIKFWQKVFLFFDVVNALQGLWIFVIFTCKPNTCRQLEAKFKKAILYLEKHRDQNSEGSVVGQLFACFAITFSTLTLPFVHFFRRLFSFCGRTTRSLESRRTISHNTVTSNTFDKSRKFCDSFSSTSSATTKTTDPGSYEMNPKQISRASPPK